MSEQVYRIFCETGRELKAQELLRGLGYGVIPSVAERMIFKHKKPVKELRPLLSGYVLFRYEGEPDWKELDWQEYMYYALGYSNNSKALKNKDLEFAHWLMQRGGVAEISKAIQVGTKIKIIDGPLKDYEGNIVKINSRSKCAEVKIDDEGVIHTIWLSYEIMEAEADTRKMTRGIWTDGPH